MKKVFLILLMLSCCYYSYAQKNNSKQPASNDTVGFVIANRGDSAFFKFDNADTVAISDTLSHYYRPTTYFKPVPSRSVWYSLLCPGLGQIYNRRYWKLPIVYTGFASLAFGIGKTNARYSEFARGYRDFADSDPNTKSYEALIPPGYPSSSIESYLSGRVNNYRRYRDLCIAGLVAWYAISVIDAFVDAQLADFDVSPDLSMRVGPKLMLENENSSKPTVGLKVQLEF